ncbi:MFS transporter [Moelleriella libera RCEF 2490]|uniref:MFS transporter n=1 Tax=Moelleriella libera RCEF 2490 TaxID=1081109 RepID=A0A162IJE4_9HYPO|nr:MFS transporter [Moelleriella libera RCEF 2490]
MGEIGAIPIWTKSNKFFHGKYIFPLALLFLAAGSAVIGSAQSIGSLVAGRAVAGFGGSGVYVSTITIISGMTTPTQQNLYLVVIGMAWSLSTILGPIIGPAFADSAATGRWAFYINVCIAAVAAPACIFIMPSVPAPNPLGIFATLREADYLGAILFLRGIISTFTLLSISDIVYGWDSGGLWTTIDETMSPGKICGYTVIQGFGIGPVIQLGYTVAQLKRPRASLLDTNGFISCAQVDGLALSLGIATCLLVNKATIFSLTKLRRTLQRFYRVPPEIRSMQ